MAERAFDVAFDTAERILSTTPRERALDYLKEQVRNSANPDFWARVREYVKSVPITATHLNGYQDDGHCSGCGKPIGDAEWKQLVLIGFQVTPAWKDEPGEVLELRNHACGSTLAKMMPFSPEDLEAGAAVELGAAGSLKRAQSVAAHNLQADSAYYKR